MSESFLVLAVVVPILTSVIPLAAGIRFERTGWTIAAVTAVVHLGLTLGVAMRVFTGGPFSYELAGFPPPVGIELVADGLTAVILVLLSIVTVGVLAYARHAGPRGNAVYAEFLLLLAGLSGVTATGDAFNLYVFLEISALAAYALVASNPSGRAAVAAFRYLLIGTVGASLYLLGVGYLFVATGTLNMADLAQRLAEVGYGSPLVLAGFGFIVAGLAVKVALFPVHTWQPEAYAAAPDAISGYIAALVSTVSAYALARLLFVVFTPAFIQANPLAGDLLVYTAGISVVAGSALAVMQSEVKRMLAYSSVSQFGLVIAAFGVASETAVLGGVIHLVGHAIMKGALFLAAGAVAAAVGARTVDDYAGLGERIPVVAGAFAVIALAMVGVPPSVGFIGKWYIVLGAVEAGAWFITVVLLASTLLTLSYFARLIERMYFADGPSPGGVEPVADGGSESNATDAISDDGDDGPYADGPAHGGGLSPGMVAAVLVATAVAVGLGFAAPVFEALLGPTVEVLVS